MKKFVKNVITLLPARSIGYRPYLSGRYSIMLDFINNLTLSTSP